MRFTDKFPFTTADLVFGVVIIAVWLFWEIWGATHKDAVTLTYLIRTTCASFRYGRLCLFIAWLVIGWHFLWYDAGWWLAFVRWCRGN